jgi:hypothetical protein
MATSGTPTARIEGELATLAPSAFPSLVDQSAGGAQQTAGLQARARPTHAAPHSPGRANGDDARRDAQCPVCEREFPPEFDLFRHASGCNGLDAALPPCPLCGLVLLSADALAAHASVCGDARGRGPHDVPARGERAGKRAAPEAPEPGAVRPAGPRPAHALAPEVPSAPSASPLDGYELPGSLACPLCSQRRVEPDSFPFPL